jgi:hypothetical protein
MKNLILILAIILLSGCAKDITSPITYNDGKLSDEDVYDLFVQPKIQGDKILTQADRCTRQIENLDSLIQTGYWLWYSIESDGTTTTYTEGQVPRIVADTAFMRCGVLGYGSAKMRLEGQPTSANRKFGVQHWPNGTIQGMQILEVYHIQAGRNWILRKDEMPNGQGLVFCTAFDGYANEGSQTGAIEVYYRDPEGDFFLANETNCTGVSILLTDANSTYTNQPDLFKLRWRNPQSEATGWDIFQECSSVTFRCDVAAETIGFNSTPNAYFGNMRSYYLSDNTCGLTANYILMSGEVQGEFTNY